ncbi:MAG: N-acetyltransferase [Bauldia sp.]|nr:N-acetyltransferase [Bauldia sp.]
MPSAAPSLAAGLRIAQSVADVARAEWDACANPGWPSDRPLESAGTDARLPYNPFVSHDFLRCVEESGSATARTGWAPRHLLLDGPGGLAGVLPLYLKSHSMGEYVFDWGWAEAFERGGRRYYPKLQASVPFTPATGRRLLALPGADAEASRRRLAVAATELTQQLGASSVHVTFMPQDEWDLCAGLGYLRRTDQQFHFLAEGYRDFDDFLAALASRKRKTLRRERAEALAGGITVEHLTGRDITEAAWDAFFAFYMDTGSRKWGRPYLNRRFFSMLGERMADRVLLVMARRAGKPIAGALNLIGSDALYGRYWGATEHHPFLHFEVCYYQAIDWALAHGLKRVEAGAQGEHKVARGYVPTPTYSAHWIADPRFRKAIADYLAHERAQTDAAIEELAEHTPFRKG